MSSADDAPRIGVVGDDVPRQLVLAAGAVPRRLLGSWHEPVTTETADLLGTVDAAAGRVLDDLLSGRHDDLAGLLVCHDSQANLRIFYVLRILAQRGRLPFPVHLVDVPRVSTSASARRFVSRQHTRLLGFCEHATGHRVDGTSLRRAAERERDLGRALEAMRARRRAGDCTGFEALEAYRAAATMSPEDAVSAVSAAHGAAVPGAAPVHMTGSNHPDPEVYRALETTGELVVVGEDHDTGDAAWLGTAVDGSTLDEVIEGLAAAHLARPATATGGLAEARAEHTLRRTEQTRARAALALVREYDDAPAWDLPRQRHALRRRGVPLVARARIRPGDGAATAARESLAELQDLLAGAAGAES